MGGGWARWASGGQRASSAKPLTLPLTPLPLPQRPPPPKATRRDAAASDGKVENYYSKIPSLLPFPSTSRLAHAPTPGGCIFPPEVLLFLLTCRHSNSCISGRFLCVLSIYEVMLPASVAVARAAPGFARRAAGRRNGEFPANGLINERALGMTVKHEQHIIFACNRDSRFKSPHLNEDPRIALNRNFPLPSYRLL